MPGIHSRPLSDDDPDIAPDLVPLRRQLMAMVGRPVNIQASRDIVTRVSAATCSASPTSRCSRSPTACLSAVPAHQLMFRLLTYNILHGGRGRTRASQP